MNKYLKNVFHYSLEEKHGINTTSPIELVSVKNTKYQKKGVKK